VETKWIARKKKGAALGWKRAAQQWKGRRN